MAVWAGAAQLRMLVHSAVEGLCVLGSKPECLDPHPKSKHKPKELDELEALPPMNRVHVIHRGRAQDPRAALQCLKVLR